MKKIVLSLFAVLALTFGAMAENGDAYTIDDAAIEQVFAQAAEVSVGEISTIDMPGLTSPIEAATVPTLSAANPWGAAFICFFLGGFGIHRHYLGTSNLMWLWYTITVGGIFGIVPLVDFIVLIVGAVDGDYGKYVGNGRFFMWV